MEPPPPGSEGWATIVSESDGDEAVDEETKQILAAAKHSIPAWDPAECQWGALGTASLHEPSADKTNLTAFQLAFALQNLPVFEAFLEHEAVQRMAGHLILTTMLTSWPASGGVWPASIANMQSIVELTVADPQNSGPVPAGIFKLTNLTALDLHSSGYTSIPDEIAQLVNLETLDLSGMKLTKIPVSQMANCQKFTSVLCTNIKVTSPPPEIVSQGPAAVAQYIISIGEGAEENHDVLLMFIGDGEAGKTSTLLALKNTETNTARAIGVDDRTIGIDISEFKPYPDVPLRFSAWDFGGQAVYAIMQQLFMSRRALYPLLWRVRESVDVSRFDTMMKCDVCRTSLLAQKGEKQQPIYRVKGQGLCHAGCASYESLIASWTERLQFRVPGVTVVLIATHIDCATPEQVDDQCDIVAKIAQRILARQDALGGDVDRLKIHNNGQSLRVNNVSGEGVKELRDQLRAVAEGLSFYGEVIPSSYARLRRKLREMQRRSDPGSWRTWMVWTEYVAMAKECGIVDKEALDVATQFFHETGELRYYGKIAKVHRVGEGTKIEANYRSKGKWYPAKIKRARDDGTYDIDYDDGEMETRVKIECIRSRDGKPLRASTSRSSNRIEEGDKVEANYRGRGRYFPAKVRRDRGDGTYDLDYDDGETELRASEDMIRLLSKGASRATPVAAPAVSTGAPKKASEPAQIPLAVGMKVQRAYRGKGALCSGRVTAVSANGTATVAYDGGFVETNVPRDGLTLTLDEHSLAPEAATSTPASSAAVAIAPGLRVTYYSKGKWEDGEIITISPTGEFEVGGAGRSSVRVGRAQWRFIGEDLFLVKARVMVDYLRLGVMYPGTIAAVNEDGTYDIDYDSGEKEYSAPKEALQTLDEEIEEIKGKFREGMKVECRYKEKERYFPGVISRCRLNGTYDIEYDDGEREMGVDPALIRVPPAAKKAAAATKKTSVLQNRKDRMNMLLSSTLFPNPFWIVDVLRGLIRHDHSAVLHLIDQDARMPLKTKNLMRRRVHRLMQRGLLHSTLLPYIWSGIAGTSEDAEKNSDEFRRLIALLGAFDILMERPGEAAGSEWVVPSLSAGKHARTMDGNAFVDEGLPFSCRIVYDSLPPYFDMMLIAHIMNNGAAQTVDFIEGAAAFRKFGNKALLFAGMGKVGDPKCVFRSEQLEDTQFKKVLREDQCHVVITSSSRRLMKALEAEVTVLEGFFPGLRRLATLFPCYSCRCARVQAQQISAAAPLARSFKSIRNLPVSSGSGDAALDQYLAAEQREVARLEDLKSVEDNPSVRDMNLDRATVAKAFPAVAQAYFDFPDFKLLVSYSELNKITGRMRIYCPDKSTQTARYQKEVRTDVW
jgi:GTPase SAR1 family protein